MVLSNENSRWSYVAAPGATTFPYDNKIFADTDLRVFIDGVETSAFSVTGAGEDSGGNVVMDTPLVGGEVVLIVRNVPSIQDIDYVENDPFPAESHEDGLDRVTIVAQQLAVLLQRSLRLPENETTAGLNDLPNLDDRKGQVLGFDASTGQPIAVVAAVASALVSAFGQTLIDDPDAATARQTLGLEIGIDVEPAGSSKLPVGGVIEYLGSAPPADWLLLNGDTLGSAASAATQASDSYETLWKLIYDGMADSEAPVSGGRTTRDADWTASKTITLPDVRGRAVIGSGAGASLTARTHGDAGGAETHQLTIDEMPAHAFTYNDRAGTLAVDGAASPVNVGSVAQQTNTLGSDQAHNNMQPWLALNYIVRAA